MKMFFFQFVLSFIFTNLSCIESNSQSATDTVAIVTTDTVAVETTDTADALEIPKDMKWSVIASDNQCGVEVAKNVVIKTQKEYTNLWKECFQNMPTVGKAPAVDFTKEWVVAVFLGTINKGGHKVTINNIDAAKTGMKVSTTHTKPGANCLSTMSIEFPFVIARVEKSVAKKISFKTTDKVEECN